MPACTRHHRCCHGSADCDGSAHYIHLGNIGKYIDLGPMNFDESYHLRFETAAVLQDNCRDGDQSVYHHWNRSLSLK